MIIPHDHHLAGAIPGRDETCPYSKEETGNHKGFPVHCHAFNDLNAEKATSFVFTSFTHLSFHLINSIPDISGPELNIIVFRNFEIVRSVRGASSEYISLLRAPPESIGQII